jgi:Flp pilus assembly protein TadD
MLKNEVNRLVAQGIAAAEEGNTLVALVHFENALRLAPTPLVGSYLGYCLARERRQLQRGRALCQQALEADPNTSTHYLNLPRIQLLGGQKPKAIATFRHGLKFGRNPHIVKELKRLGLRKAPVFAGLDRGHLLNRFTGKVLSRLKLR